MAVFYRFADWWRSAATSRIVRSLFFLSSTCQRTRRKKRRCGDHGGVGGWDAEGHVSTYCNSAPRGRRSPPPSEPEGLARQPSSAAVASVPLPSLLFLVPPSPPRPHHCSESRGVWGEKNVCLDSTVKMYLKGGVSLKATFHLIITFFFCSPFCWKPSQFPSSHVPFRPSPPPSPLPSMPLLHSPAPLTVCLLSTVGGGAHSNTKALQGQSLYPFFSPLPVLLGV